MAYNKTQEVFSPQKRYEHSKVNINMRIICIRNLKDSLELIQSTPEKEVSLSMIGKRVVVILLVILFFSLCHCLFAFVKSGGVGLKSPFYQQL